MVSNHHLVWLVLAPTSKVIEIPEKDEKIEESLWGRQSILKVTKPYYKHVFFVLYFIL